MGFLLKGFVIGLAIAFPIGPVGVLCMHRTLKNGRLSGLVSGFGAATADGLYGAMAAFGLTFISNLLFLHPLLLRWIGGVFLFYLGVRIFLSRPQAKKAEGKKTNLVGDYLSALFLTMTNPATPLALFAIFAGLGFGSSNSHYIAATRLVLGVVLGSIFWWLLLCEGVRFLKSKANFALSKSINQIAGAIVMGLAILTITGILQHL